ncbi:conserved hypothetical protein [Xanthomonas oryzae pv. oryzae KACC 10331]|uniref:Uncharacterized protein n=1 Tax=Xanthomonas oryzae pv. oryzae (strain KACC10331 / KXO85) TaxID=291331 RepID=Q5GVR5_XANOR|nr:conserved hypothetical protein [Xanthomonas oryzae pv. oryzae KACC 10331]
MVAQCLMRGIELLAALGAEADLDRDIFAAGRMLPADAFLQQLHAGGGEQTRKFGFQPALGSAHGAELEGAGKLEAVIGVVGADVHPLIIGPEMGKPKPTMRGMGQRNHLAPLLHVSAITPGADLSNGSLGQFQHGRGDPAAVAHLVFHFPHDAFLGAGGVQHHARLQRAHSCAGALGIAQQTPCTRDRDRLLRVRRRRIAGQPAELADDVGVSLQICQRDHLADLGIGVTPSTGLAVVAAAEDVATRAPAQIGLLGIAFSHGDLFGRTHIGDGQHHVGSQLAEVETTDQVAGIAAHQATQHAGNGAAAGIVVLRNAVRRHHIIGSADLPLAHVGTRAQIAIGRYHRIREFDTQRETPVYGSFTISRML